MHSRNFGESGMRWRRHPRRCQKQFDLLIRDLPAQGEEHVSYQVLILQVGSAGVTTWRWASRQNGRLRGAFFEIPGCACDKVLRSLLWEWVRARLGAVYGLAILIEYPCLPTALELLGNVERPID